MGSTAIITVRSGELHNVRWTDVVTSIVCMVTGMRNVYNELTMIYTWNERSDVTVYAIGLFCVLVHVCQLTRSV